MDSWCNLKLSVSITKVELEEEEEIKTEDLIAEIKLTTGELISMKIGDNPITVEIKNGYGVLR